MQHLHATPFSELDVSLVHLSQDCSSTCIHSIVQDLPDLGGSDVEDGVDRRLKRLPHDSRHVGLELKLDVVHQYEVHVTSSRALRGICRRVQRALVVNAGYGTGGGFTDESDETSVKMGF